VAVAKTLPLCRPHYSIRDCARVAACTMLPTHRAVKLCMVMYVGAAAAADIDNTTRCIASPHFAQALYIESLQSLHDAAAARASDNDDEHEPEAVVSLLADGLYLFCGMQYGNVHLWNLAGVSTAATSATTAAAAARDNNLSGSSGSSSSAAGCARGVGLCGAVYMGLIRAHILDMSVAAMCITPYSAG
jgi:hypothetical protein